MNERNEKINILAILPYEGMKPLMQEAARKFNDIEMNVFVGDMEEGLYLASRNFYNDYDIIVSRGGTASMLRQKLDVPIVEIEISPLDILRAMKIGKNISSNYAIIGFPNITNNAHVICRIIKSKMDIYTINSADGIEDYLHRICLKGTKSILCDMVAYRTALKLGLDPVLIKSGEECIESALQRARQLYYTHKNLREENKFLRKMIWKQINHTIAFAEDGSIFFSTLENNDLPIVSYLRSELHRKTEENDCRIIKQISNIRYSIRMTKECLSQREYTIFYYKETKVSSPEIKKGIRYLGTPEADKELEEGIYGAIGISEDLTKKIDMLKQNDRPLLIYGEDGTCKEQIAKYIYTKSSWRNFPLVIIDSFMLNKKAWSYLIEHYNSPLAQDGATIFIKNIDVLTPIQRRRLLASVLEMNVCKRNRMIFSCICDSKGSITEAGRDFMEILCSLTLYLPPLRENKEHFSSYINKYLSYANIKAKNSLGYIEPEVLDLLKSYFWPHNYTQFQRVLEELLTMSDDGVIKKKDAEAVLKRENAILTMNDKVEDANIRIDLNQPLEKINREIVRKVVEEEGGNKTNAARRLEIARSTLWRILNKE